MVSKFTLEQINSRIPKESYLKAISFDRRRPLPCGQKTTMIICLCKCGNATVVSLYKLFSGHTLSCGCLRDNLRRRKKYINDCPSLRRRYYHMIARCYNKTDTAYSNYGGRGVRVCDEWLSDYQKFVDWANSNGFKKHLHLDKDIKGDGLLYSPDTCCWVTQTVNSSNKRTDGKHLFRGKEMSLAQIAKLTNIPFSTLRNRIKVTGIPLETAINYSRKKNGYWRKRRKKIAA